MIVEKAPGAAAPNSELSPNKAFFCLLALYSK
jgi:hypothetical protein